MNCHELSKLQSGDMFIPWLNNLEANLIRSGQWAVVVTPRKRLGIVLYNNVDMLVYFDGTKVDVISYTNDVSFNNAFSCMIVMHKE